MSSLTHSQRVKFLYKTILKLHRSLPSAMKELGDRYVKEEFKKHKNAKPEYIQPFMVEWSKYASQLAKQIKHATGSSNEIRLGARIDQDSYSNFTEDQLNQLLLLAEEIHESNK